MASVDNAMFEVLLEQIKKMNANLETSSSAINNLTLRIKSLELPNSSSTVGPSFQSNRTSLFGKTESLAAPSTNLHEQKIFRTLGYVNWDAERHSYLKNYKLVRISDLNDLIIKMIALTSTSAPVSSTGFGVSSTGFGVSSTTRGFGSHEITPVFNTTNINNPVYQTSINNQDYSFHFAELNRTNIMRQINKEIRFPLDAVYINVESPRVKQELIFMDKLNIKPSAGVLERIYGIIEEEKLTCARFESTHGLKWE